MGLSPKEKRFIVERLACFDSPSDVAKAFESEFKKEISRQSVEIYDAAKPRLKERMSKDLIELFSQTRTEFVEKVENIPIANRAVRLRRLDRMVDRLMDGAKPNLPLAASLIEQAAKEMGGIYTNKRDVTSGGKPIATVPLINLAELDEEEIDRRLAAAEGRKAS